jgi:hypothetical protein
MPGDTLHIIARERRGVGDDRTRIAAGAHVREDMD